MSEQWSVKVRNLDFSECKYRGEIYELLRTELELPRWCGSNLNALWDAVTGIMYTPVEIRIVRKAKIGKINDARPIVHSLGKRGVRVAL